MNTYRYAAVIHNETVILRREWLKAFGGFMAGAGLTFLTALVANLLP